MFSNVVSMSTQFSGAEQQSLQTALQSFVSALKAKRRERGLSAAQNPYEAPANFVLILTSRDILVAIDPVTPGDTPTHRYLDHRATVPAPTLEDLLASSTRDPALEYKKPIGLKLPLTAIAHDESVRQRALEEAAAESMKTIMEQSQASRFQLPAGHEHYSRFVPSFLADHPDLDRTVFLMMRFRSGQQYQDIHGAIKDGFARYGLKVLRADDRDFTGDLWENVCLYMLGCRYGVAVFEEIDLREFNPNVAMELGFMMAINKRCLLLKDQRMSGLPTDVIGRLYRSFDTYNIRDTIMGAIDKWAVDMRLQPSDKGSDLGVLQPVVRLNSPKPSGRKR